MGIRSDAVTVYGSGLAIHWETGKGNAVTNEVRRPACVWNLKPAANRLVFLRTYDPTRINRTDVYVVRSSEGGCVKHSRFYISFRTNIWKEVDQP